MGRWIRTFCWMLALGLLLLDVLLFRELVFRQPVDAIPVQTPQGPSVRFQPIIWTTWDFLYLGVLALVHVAVLLGLRFAGKGLRR